MKRSLFISAFIFLPSFLFAQSHTKDEMAIKQVIQQQESAWNKYDWEAFSNYFTDDATLINFVGQFWKGKHDILAHFKLLGDCCLVPTSLKFEFINARFINSDIAIVYSEETLHHNKDYDVPFRHYKKGETEYKMLTHIFVKKNNEWKISAAQLTLINQILSPHNTSGKH
ncbi:SgcJ/EcaC family oxidoreductase [Rhodocytophaga rosea]|uniref:SgcJ/EcaC family oxidoreductase n=1 Tax=Rhodocytophaga rosea TaxID=2704465 RepID=A0A6C0GFB8_9BACT|nr:SgcJ/EcaC family oxidoreductase [Rhodocytophaga rosea]QHT66711.1 SgcJ/EcaC family oxidoreductase [Rhodocytophaga rosea]